MQFVLLGILWWGRHIVWYMRCFALILIKVISHTKVWTSWTKIAFVSILRNWFLCWKFNVVIIWQKLWRNDGIQFIRDQICDIIIISFWCVLSLWPLKSYLLLCRQNLIVKWTVTTMAMKSRYILISQTWLCSFELNWAFCFRFVW